MDDIKQEPQYATTGSSSNGLADNVAGALAYVTIIPAIIFLVIEPYNKRPFVRFHAFQCLALAVISFVVSLVLAIIPFFGWFILRPIWAILILICAILCIVKAYSGVKFKLPVIGDFAENMAAK